MNENGRARHSVRLKTVDDEMEYEASFACDEQVFSNGASHGSIGYCVATSLMMLGQGSAQSLLYAIADAIEVLSEYDPFEHTPAESKQDRSERDAALRMIQAGCDFTALRAERRKKIGGGA